MSDLRERVKDIVEDMEHFARGDRSDRGWSPKSREWHTGRAVGYEAAVRWLRTALEATAEGGS